MNIFRKLFGKIECGKCGRTKAQIMKDFAEFKKMGVGGGVGLLYCESCKKYICSECQVDLGYYTGCPICRKALD